MMKTIGMIVVAAFAAIAADGATATIKLTDRSISSRANAGNRSI
jgi:hypothetical protein